MTEPIVVRQARSQLARAEQDLLRATRDLREAEALPRFGTPPSTVGWWWKQEQMRKARASVDIAERMIRSNAETIARYEAQEARRQETI